METIICRQTVTTVSPAARVATRSFMSPLLHWYAHHPLSWHRRCRSILRALACGAMLH